MDIDLLIEYFGSDKLSALFGLFVGLLFGIFAYKSNFCLRSAAIEFWRGRIGNNFVIWLLAFAMAIFGTQILVLSEWLDTDNIRSLNSAGSMSGAIIGGLLFGSGMILARGCASRLLVLSATGNLRALVAGVFIALVALMTLNGVLAPMSNDLASLWTVNEYNRGLASWLPNISGVIIGLGLLSMAIWQGWRQKINWRLASFGILTGLSIALAWFLNGWHAENAFDNVTVKSISLTSAYIKSLNGLTETSTFGFSFDIGIVPGIFLGSLASALFSREFKWQHFTNESNVGRYLLGAGMMGFGGVLALGCSVGAGLSNGGILLITALTSLLCMWISAGATDWLVDRPKYSELSSLKPQSSYS